MFRKFVLTFFVSIALFGFWAGGAKAASLYLSPASKQINVGNIVNVQILVDTQGQAINNAQGVITFPADLLQVVSVSDSASIFTLWVQNPAFSNNSGNVSFNGGLPTPGYTGSAGDIINIVFRAKGSGTATVVVSSGSVLANDGFGTDVLTSQGQANFTLVGSQNTPAPASPSPSPASSAPPGSPAAAQIFSVTHPDQNTWYNNSSPAFNWSLDSAATAVRILYDTSPYAQPSVVYDPPITEKSLSGLPDGIYYFHLQEKNAIGWGAVSNFRFQIDTANPDHFNIKQIPDNDPTDPVAQFSFDAFDKTSGIDHYLVQIDNNDAQIWQPTADNIYSTPALQSGQHTLIAKAVDKAGNYLVNTADFTIEAMQAPVITKYPQTITEGNLLAIEGTAASSSQVTVWIQKQNSASLTQNVQTDGNGNFSLIADDNFTKGVYTVWAKAVDSRGAQSGSSNIVTTVVIQTALERTGMATLNFLELAVPAIALIILLMFILWFSWNKFKIIKKKVRRDAGETQSAMHQVFSTLRENMSAQIRLLEKTKGHRELTEEELKIVKQLKKDLGGMEQFLSDEIGRVERDVK